MNEITHLIEVLKNHGDALTQARHEIKMIKHKIEMLEITKQDRELR